jgi:ribosome-binding protein aMBF1 (putative translation factor)
MGTGKKNPSKSARADMRTLTAPRIELIIDRRKYVAVPEEDYERLIGSSMPALPPADSKGNRDAVKFAEASIARNIVKRREAAGLSQKELAKAAGIRAEVLNRAERGAVVPSTRTLTKIDVALTKVGRRC